MDQKKNNNMADTDNLEDDTSPKRQISLQYYKDKEFPEINKILHVSGVKTASCYLDTTAIRVPDAIYGASGISSDHFLSEDYLLNFKKSSIDLSLSYGLSNYASFEVRATLALMDKKEKQQHHQRTIVKLPTPQKIQQSYDALIRKRRSKPKMSGKELSLEQLSTLLFYADGVTGTKKVIDPAQENSWPRVSLGEPDPHYVRSAPSAGALYPIDLYLLVRNVDKLHDGLYQYRPNTHSLVNMRALSEKDWDIHEQDAMGWGAGFDPKNVNVAVFYVYSLFRNSRKYADLGLAFGFIEVGMIAQNLHLAAEALDLASNCCGGGNKATREKFLGVDGQTQHLVHLTLIGQLG